MKIAVIAGTPVDTQMGVDLLKRKGAEGTGFPVSRTPEEQTAFQVGSQSAPGGAGVLHKSLRRRSRLHSQHQPQVRRAKHQGIRRSVHHGPLHPGGPLAVGGQDAHPAVLPGDFAVDVHGRPHAKSPGLRQGVGVDRSGWRSWSWPPEHGNFQVNDYAPPLWKTEARRSLFPRTGKPPGP